MSEDAPEARHKERKDQKYPTQDITGQQFRRQLVSIEASEREKAVDALNEYLSKHAKDGNKEFMAPLWKALFYAMWLADKVPFQRKLADQLARYMIGLPYAWEYQRGFWNEVCQSWPRLDVFRLDKYYYFMRAFIRYSIHHLSSEKWAGIPDFQQVLRDYPLSTKSERMPKAISFHVVDLFLGEVTGSINGRIPKEHFAELFRPFIEVIGESRDDAICSRIDAAVSEPLLKTPNCEHAALKAVVEDVLKTRQVSKEGKTRLNQYLGRIDGTFKGIDLRLKPEEIPDLTDPAFGNLVAELYSETPAIKSTGDSSWENRDGIRSEKPHPENLEDGRGVSPRTTATRTLRSNAASPQSSKRRSLSSTVLFSAQTPRKRSRLSYSPLKAPPPFEVFPLSELPSTGKKGPKRGGPGSMSVEVMAEPASRTAGVAGNPQVVNQFVAYEMSTLDTPNRPSHVAPKGRSAPLHPGKRVSPLNGRRRPTGLSKLETPHFVDSPLPSPRKRVMWGLEKNQVKRFNDRYDWVQASPISNRDRAGPLRSVLRSPRVEEKSEQKGKQGSVQGGRQASKQASKQARAALL